MDDSRRKRYLDKLDRLEERLGDINGWLEDSNEELLANKERRLAVYKAYQEAVEAITDICAMYLADTGRGIGDDSQNIQKAAGRLFSEGIERKLVEANGLRNRVTHDYNTFDTTLALNSMREQEDAMHTFLTEAKEWINNR